MNSEKTKLVVINENCFCYITEDRPDTAHILHSSVLRGYVGSSNSPITLNPLYNKLDSIRPANLQDFVDYRISSEGYFNDENCDFVRKFPQDMTLTEYVNQSDPVKFPTVILQPDEYETFETGQELYKRIHIFEYPMASYMLEVRSGQVWTTDETGRHKKTRSVFRTIPDHKYF